MYARSTNMKKNKKWFFKFYHINKRNWFFKYILLLFINNNEIFYKFVETNLCLPSIPRVDRVRPSTVDSRRRGETRYWFQG